MSMHATRPRNQTVNVPLSARERHVLRIALVGLKQLQRSTVHSAVVSAAELDRLLNKIGTP